MSFSQNSSANRFVLVGAVVAPLAGIAYYLSRRKTAQGGRAAPVLPAAIAHVAPDTDPQVWSATDVHRWLASIGAAEEVMAAFYRDGVDGVTLPLLQDSHLEKMGIVSVSQRVRALREIRVLFNFPITESVANTPGVSPTASLHRQRHVAAAPVAESEEVPAVTARHVDPAAPSSQEAQTHAITTLAGKMQRWYHVLTSAEFAGLALNEQQERVAQAARELAAIARLLQTLPPSPPVQELKALAAQLMDVISAANEVIEEAAAREAQAATAARQPPASADGMHNQAAAEKVAELLIQFEKVLRSPEISSVPEQQRRDMARGIGDQLVKIRENVVPALPENQRDAFRDKCDALLEICVKLQSDPRPMGVRQPGIAQGCCGGAAHEHEAAVAMAQADQVSQTDQPQPASLNFIITRMRGVFDVIRSPQFMQEADPERLRASIADAAKEVHQLTLESQHLPADQQEVVHQVAKNIMDVLSKMAQAVQQARQQSTATAPAVGQRPMAQPRAAQQHATNGSAEADQTPAAREVEVAQQMSRQLVAMLNVLKSDEFEAAPPLQRRALANRMQNDLAVMNERLATQPPQLREMLEPTVAKLCDFVAAVLSMTAEPAEIASRAAAPAAQAPAPSAAGIDAAQQISKQLVAMLNVLKSVEFEKASPDQKRQLALRVKNDLQSISERLRTQPPKIQELLAPTHAKLEEFVGAVLEMTANLGDAAPAAQQGPTANDVDVARGLSKQLVNMLGLLKSKEFDEAPLSAKREVAVAMRRDLEAIGARVRDQPREIQELVEPTRAKIANFVDAIIAMADEEASFKQPKPESPQKAQQKSGKSPSKAAQAQAHAQAQAQQQEREPSPALLLLMRQLNQVAEIVTGDEFDTASNSKKLDVIVQCQQLLGSLVQRVADLDGVEQTVAMSQANKLNHLLKSIADPILAAVDEAGEPDEENDGEEPQENSAADGTSNAAALNVVQRTQRLFQMINDDSFLDSEPAELRRKAAVMKRELQEITAVCARLDAAQRSDLIPVIRSLADILDKVEAAATVAAGGGGQRGDDDEEADEDAGNEGGDDDAAQQDARRNKIYRLAQEMTAALLSGQFTVEDIAGVEQLSTLLSLLDSCGISNENELRIREQYQNAVERAVSNLSRRLGGDPQNGTRDDGDDGEEEEEEEDEDEDGDEPSRVEELPDPPQPPVTRLRPVESSRVDAVPDDEQDEADEGEEEEEEDDGDEPQQQQQQQQQQNQQNEAVSHQLEQIIARLNSASSPADLERIVPVLADLSRSQVAGRDRRHLALISQAVGLLQRKRAEFAQAAKTDLRPLKNTLRRIIVGLRTANETQISALIKELTAATDATDAWKQDQEATNLVNAAIAEVSAAVKRLEGRRGASSQSSEQSPSRTIQLITEATRRVREGRDPTQFLPLAVELSRRRPQLTEQEAAALDDFERALQEVRSMGARTTSTSSDDLLTPPNTPASPAKPVQRQPAPAPLAQAQPEDGNEDVEEEEEAEEEEAVDEEEDHERTILDVVNKIKQRVEATDPKSFQDLAPFIAILQRLRQGPSATPAVDRAVTEVEDLLRAQVAKLKAQSSELREEQLEHKRRMINELYSMLNHAHFGSLDPEARNTVMRKATALLKSLDANEQTVLHDESQRLLEALMTATEKEEEANEESEDELSVNADLALLPRIVERLGTADFMENCSTFEIQAIARTLSRLEVAEFAEINAEFKAIVKNATKLLADRASSFTGSAKDAKAVSTPLNLTGMDSETDQGHAVVRYTLFSSEEEEDFTPNEVFVNRFKRSPVTEATLPESGVESWRGKSVAILFVFEQSPLDAESVNQTAHAEANQLTDVLEADQGFEVIRVWGTPTPRSVSEALAGLAGRDLKRLFIYVQNPAVKAQLPPVPEHAIVFEGGQVLKHNALLSVAKEHSEHVVVFHDNGSSMEIVCSFKGEESAHVGVSVTEAGFLVANSGRCWLYDGLFTPILIEALSIGKRTLCPEDLVNTSVRVLSVTDGSDGPYLTDSPSTARAFFAPGLEASE